MCNKTDQIRAILANQDKVCRRTLVKRIILSFMGKENIPEDNLISLVAYHYNVSVSFEGSKRLTSDYLRSLIQEMIDSGTLLRSSYGLIFKVNSSKYEAALI